MSGTRVNGTKKWLSGLARLTVACACSYGVLGKAPGQVIINGRVIGGGAIIYNAGPQNTAAPLPPAVGDVIRFADGSELHGELRSIMPGQVVRWQHPEAKKEIDFRPDNINSIHFANVVPANRNTNADAAFKPSCQVRLADGDVFFGALPVLDQEKLTLNTAFAGEAKVPRASVQSIALLPRDFSVVYDGPLAAKEWQISPPNGWSFRDGVFVSQGSGALSSEFDVPGSATLEFDLAWEGFFNLMISLYSGQRQDSEGFNSYFLNMSSSAVDVRRQSPTSMTSLGRTEIPGLVQKGKCRFTIQCNRKEGSLTLWADHQLVKRWKDTPEFLNNGLRVFFSDMTGRKGVRISNIRVMSWQQVEPTLAAATAETNLDSVSLINRDMARGKITGIEGGNLKLQMGERTLTVPLTRVTRIDFAAGTNATTARPQEVRAWLVDGGRVSFRLDRWDAERVAAHSSVFGDFSLQSQSIRELEFNLGRPRSEAAATHTDLRGLDD